jgi:hypothetical protein
MTKARRPIFPAREPMFFTVPRPKIIRVAVANSNSMIVASFPGQCVGKVTICGKKIDDICQFNDFSLYRKIVNYLIFKLFMNYLTDGTEFVCTRR